MYVFKYNIFLGGLGCVCESCLFTIRRLLSRFLFRSLGLLEFPVDVFVTVVNLFILWFGVSMCARHIYGLLLLLLLA